MILDIDHVTFTSNNLNNDISVLKRLGYEVRFFERKIKNLDIKKTLLEKFTSSHDLVLLDKSGSFSIELVSYDNIGSKISFYEPFFAIENKEFTQDFLSLSDDNISFRSEDFVFNKLLVTVGNICRAVSFWKLLGFKVVLKNNNLVILKFTSLFKKSDFFIYLKEDKSSLKKVFLDSQGFNALAFITSSVDREIKALHLQSDIEITQPRTLMLGQRSLELFFQNGPNGELVEVIGVNN